MNILEANPLLEGIPEPGDFVTWGRWLYADPRAELPASFLKNKSKALPFIHSVYVPREQDIDAAFALHEILYHELVKRNPLTEKNKREIYVQLKAQDYTDDDEDSFGTLPWFSGSAPGAIFVGPTGCGKSTLIERILARFPQVLHRTENQAAGWAKLDQLVYLSVHMPDDGTRSGLFEAIALAMDEKLGTSYAVTLRGLRSVSSQGLYVLRRLQAHRCGLLVVEEAQQENIGVQTHGKVFVRFFLRVMNFGIPVLLIGAPRAFEKIREDSQLYRRLVRGGEYEFGPELCWTTAHWNEALMPHVGEWTIFDAPDEIDVPNFSRACWEATGGFPGYLAELRAATLRECIKRNGSAPNLTDFEKALKSATFKPYRNLATAVAERKVNVLGKMKDISLAFFQKLWTEFDDERTRERQERQERESSQAEAAES
ncbi:ATP-binding protein [Variovorax sp. RB2P76]|uniref:ATP-binding protein n=1 Tax=Variovorax sp. RB2P76 TaxID=3443736 RepID=UPI003F4470AA